jgi:hypothetical protein
MALRNLTIAILAASVLLLMQACGHPLEIVGEGDIVDLNNSGHGCTLEQFQSKAKACENWVLNEYDVNYTAVPKPGWEFVRWEGACAPISVFPYCRLRVSENLVKEYYFQVMPPTVAIFAREGTVASNNWDTGNWDNITWQ